VDERTSRSRSAAIASSWESGGGAGQHPAVEEAVVLAAGTGADKELVAYVAGGLPSR